MQLIADEIITLLVSLATKKSHSLMAATAFEGVETSGVRSLSTPENDSWLDSDIVRLTSDTLAAECRTPSSGRGRVRQMMSSVILMLATSTSSLTSFDRQSCSSPTPPARFAIIMTTTDTGNVICVLLRFFGY